MNAKSIPGLQFFSKSFIRPFKSFKYLPIRFLVGFYHGYLLKDILKV